MSHGANNYEIDLDWAYVNFIFNPEITLQASRKRLPLLLFKSGMNVESIAFQRDLTQSTITNHLEKLIQQGHVALNDVVSIPQQEISIIQGAIIELGEEAKKLKSVFEYLDG